MSSSNTFSILGKNLKANGKADLEPFLSKLAALDDVEEVHFGGNSLGVEACQAIAEVLRAKTKLKVSDTLSILLSLCRLTSTARRSCRYLYWAIGV